MDTLEEPNESSTLSKTKLHPVTRAKVTFRLCLSVFAAVMGSFQFGYNTGVINAPETSIENFMNKSQIDRNGKIFSQNKVSSLFSLIVAFFAVGGMFGGLLAGWWANFFGRRNGMLLNCFIGIAGGVLLYFSRLAEAYEMIMVGRCVIGINCGLITGLTPIYLSEISTPHTRGALGVLHQFGVTFGILLSQILGFPEILGNDKYWELLLGLTVVPCILQLILLPFCPESPRYSLLTKDREAVARKALRILRGTDEVETDIEEMKREDFAAKSEAQVGFFKLFKKRSLRMPLIISIVMQLSQQLSGINAIFYYSASVFRDAGLTEDAASHATSGVGAAMVVMTMITIPLMDRVGRRTLHLIGLAGMFVFSLLITIVLALKDSVEWFKTASVVVSLLYVCFFALGPGSIPWLIVSELFSQGPRASAMSVAVLVNWLANFAVGYGYKQLQLGIGDFSFLPFTVLLAVFWLFTFKFLPETKNKTIEEISAKWRTKDHDGVTLDENKIAYSDLNKTNE